MNFLIVEKAPDSTTHINPKYSGTGRSGPTYPEGLSKDSEFDLLFRWYMDEIANGTLNDLKLSQRFIELLHQNNPNQKYDLIEIVDGDRSPSVESIFLGFDIDEGYGNSLIQWGLKSFSSKETVPTSIRHFSDLINYTFSPHLNAQGLFQLFEIASYCRQSMVALQSLYPSFYEGGDLNRFSVTGIFQISK